MTLPKQDQITSIGCSQDEEWEYELVPVDMLEDSEDEDYEYAYDLPDDEKIYKIQEEEDFGTKRRGRRIIVSTNVKGQNHPNHVLRKKRKKKKGLDSDGEAK